MEAAMNWKEVPHLFINGEFKLRFDQDHAQHNLKGEIVEFTTEILFELERIGTDCTLIARKIEDMTITEYEDVFYALYGNEEEDLYNEYFKHNQLHDFVLMNVNKTPVFLHLLSIGVYPFDQSHFKDGTVIDINTL